jgi:hypothetical protein
MATDFISLLYADQSLEELHALRPAVRGAGTMATLFDARELDRTRRRQEAVGRLILLTQDPNAASRVRLWAATTLRSWGFVSEGPDAAVGLGVVLRIGHLKDEQIIAAYRDSSLRYVVNGVPLAVYEGGDRSCDQAISTALAHADQMIHGEEIYAGLTRPSVTILTFRGHIDGTYRHGADALIQYFAKSLLALSALQKTLHGRAFPIVRNAVRE